MGEESGSCLNSLKKKVSGGHVGTRSLWHHQGALSNNAGCLVGVSCVGCFIPQTHTRGNAYLASANMCGQSMALFGALLCCALDELPWRCSCGDAPVLCRPAVAAAAA